MRQELAKSLQLLKRYFMIMTQNITMLNQKQLLDQSFPQVVGEGCVFVLGDNRNNSTDSRSHRVGQVRQEKILGKVVLVLWPLGHFGAPA